MAGDPVDADLVKLRTIKFNESLYENVGRNKWEDWMEINSADLDYQTESVSLRTIDKLLTLNYDK